jgi:hypothetical protein
MDDPLFPKSIVHFYSYTRYELLYKEGTRHNLNLLHPFIPFCIHSSNDTSCTEEQELNAKMDRSIEHKDQTDFSSEQILKSCKQVEKISEEATDDLASHELFSGIVRRKRIEVFQTTDVKSRS